jgi:hypothetical protein
MQIFKGQVSPESFFLHFAIFNLNVKELQTIKICCWIILIANLKQNCRKSSKIKSEPTYIV